MSHPLDDQWRKLSQHFSPLGGVTVWGGEVEVDHGDGTVDIKPTDERLGPGTMHAQVALIGPFTVEVLPGSPCLFLFCDGDRSKPVVVAYMAGAKFMRVSVDATEIDIGPTATAVNLGKGLKPVVSVGDSTDPVVNGKPALISTTVNQVVKV